MVLDLPFLSCCGWGRARRQHDDLPILIFDPAISSVGAREGEQLFESFPGGHADSWVGIFFGRKRDAPAPRDPSSGIDEHSVVVSGGGFGPAG